MNNLKITILVAVVISILYLKQILYGLVLITALIALYYLNFIPLFWLVALPVIIWSLYDDILYLKWEFGEVKCEIILILITFATTLGLTKILPLPWALIFPLLALTVYTDIRYRVILNFVVVTFISLGLYYYSTPALISSLYCFFIFLPFIIFGGIGLGDMKLTAGIGAILGYGGGINVLLYSLLLALTYVFIKKISAKEVRQWLRDSYFVYLSSIKTRHLKLEIPTDQKQLKQMTVPLGAFFFPGTLIYYYYGFFT